MELEAKDGQSALKESTDESDKMDNVDLTGQLETEDYRILGGDIV